MTAYRLTEACAHLGELVAEARHTHRPVTITEHGKPVVAIIGMQELTDLEEGLAVAKHLADKAAGRVTGFTDDELDEALDRYEARDE
jgi:prevent-host-death family protein